MSCVTYVPDKTKLILKCGLPLGDLVLLTAAVRDLHGRYPRMFETDVRTLCPELWENNPHVLPVDDGEPGAEVVDCAYRLVHRSNGALYDVIPGAAQPQANDRKFSQKETKETKTTKPLFPSFPSVENLRENERIPLIVVRLYRFSK